MNRILVGIDPDKEASGVAIIRGSDHEMTNLNVPDLVRKLQELQNEGNLEVYLEGGWLNKKANYHGAKGARVREEIARWVGVNHGTGMVIEQFLKDLGINYHLIQPNKATKKLTAMEFIKITRILGRTNQDQRDAYMLIFGR